MAAHLGYFLLCVRFLAATGGATGAPAAFGVLVGGAALMTAWNPVAAFEAFLILLPFLFAVGRLGMMAPGAPEMAVFASFSVIVMLRGWLPGRLPRRAALPEAVPVRGWEAWFVAIADLLAATTLLSLARWL